MAIDGGLSILFQNHIRDGFWQRIETAVTGRGIPDLHYCIDGASGWIELKQTAASAMQIHPEQCAWLERYARNGGRAFIAVRQKAAQGRVRTALDNLYLFPPFQARNLKTNGIKGSRPLGWWTGGPAHWDWEAIRKILTSPSSASVKLRL